MRNVEQALRREGPVLVEIDRLGMRWHDVQKLCRKIACRGSRKGDCVHAPTAKEIAPGLAGHY